MIDSGRAAAALRERGATMFTGVPCSFLGPLISRIEEDPVAPYVGATSEGEAAGIAVGSWLAGGAPVVMCQNSGLGNMVNPLTTLAHPCRIPVLILCTWRGEPGLRDEPQHELMGRVLEELLDLLDVAHARVGTTATDFEGCVEAAGEAMRARSLPYCLIVGGGLWSDRPRPARAESRRRGAGAENGRRGAGVESGRRRTGALIVCDPGERPRRVDVLRRLLETVDEETAIVAGTGKTGRELYTLADRPQHFYHAGAMGCASAVALGVALGTSRRVLVLDGDGAALMKLGNLATIGVQAPANLVHVLLDNGVHDSTGGQATAARHIRLAEVATACGYRRAVVCDRLADFETALRGASVQPGPALIQVRIQPGSIEPLGRPTVAPPVLARRFRDFVMQAPAPPASPRGAADGRRPHGAWHPEPQVAVES